MFDVGKIRQDFPILQQKINDKPLIYFDNAATTQKPQAVIDALNHYYTHDNSNVHRGLHTLSERSTQQYEDARGKVKRFINAKDRREIIFVRGSTEAINLVAQSFVRPRMEAAEEILVTEMEHHSNIVPWQIISKQAGVNLRVLSIKNNGELDLEKFESLISSGNTKFLAITHASNALGTINPIKEMIRIAHEHDVLVLVDGSQAAPHIKIDVQDLDCDFYTISGHKMYAPTGIGALYGKAELLKASAPYQTGGEMITQVSFENTEYADIPHKFEAGTPNIAGAIGLGAAIDYIHSIGHDNMAEYENKLNEYLHQQIKTIDGIGLLGTAAEKVPLVSFNIHSVHAHDVGTILNSVGIAIRAGHHCAMPIMDHFDIAAAARASLAFYNTMEEVDIFIEALRNVKEVFG